MAGGTDLLVQMKNCLRRVSHVVSLANIPDLDRITYRRGEGLHLGPLATHDRVTLDPLIREKFTALALACGAVGSPQIRNLGTVAGNLANASPSADSAPALLALGAEVLVTGPDGERRVDLAEFFLGPGRTVLRSSELIKEVFVPEPAPGTRSTYLKLGRRRALEVAICGVALTARPEAGGWRGCSGRTWV